MEDTLKGATGSLALCLALAASPPALAAPPPAPGSSAKETVLLAKLRARIEAVDARLDGVLGVFVKDLTTGATVAIRSDEVFPAASTIKLAVFYELYRQADERRLDLAETTRPEGARVRGGGVLQELSDSVSLTVRDLAVLMMAWSDNEAANVLIQRVGPEAVIRRLDALGLARTRLRRRMMDLEAARRGDENVSTPRDLVALLEALHRGTGLAPERAEDARAVLGAMQDNSAAPDSSSAFRRGLPAGVRAYTKPGELEGVRCEAGLVDLAGRPYAAAVMTTYLLRDGDGEAAIREISAATYEAFDRLARASDLGRIISER
jgi:beta-lactamase class A